MNQIFDNYSDEKSYQEFKIRKLCLLAFWYNFQQYLKILNPSENLLSTRKLNVLRCELSLYIKGNSLYRENIFLDFSLENRDLIFPFLTNHLELIQRINIKYSEVKKIANIKKYQKHFIILRDKFFFSIESREKQLNPLVCYYDQIFNEFLYELKSKKHIIRFLDSIDRTNFNSAYILKYFK